MPRRTYAERLRLMRSKWNEEWWSIALCGPVGNLINALIADVPWITPNTITVIGFLCKVAICPLLVVGGRGADIATVVLLQLAVICDCMDGSLARYRKASSVLGAFLDKVTDALGLLLIFGGLGWRVYQDTGDAAAIAVSASIAATLIIRGYVYWVVSALEKQAPTAKATVGVDKRIDFGGLPFGERARLYARSMWRVVEFSESDLYFWLGLGLLLGELRFTTYGLAVATGVWFVIILSVRFRTVLRLERMKRS